MDSDFYSSLSNNLFTDGLTNALAVIDTGNWIFWIIIIIIIFVFIILIILII